MPEQRRNQRFQMKLPVELVRTGSRKVNEMGETRNLSSGGVLFTSELPIEVGEPIEYMITLPSGPKLHGHLRLRCVGKILRMELNGPADSGVPNIFAATLERYEFVRDQD